MCVCMYTCVVILRLSYSCLFLFPLFFLLSRIRFRIYFFFVIYLFIFFPFSFNCNTYSVRLRLILRVVLKGIVRSMVQILWEYRAISRFFFFFLLSTFFPKVKPPRVFNADRIAQSVGRNNNFS